MAEKSDKKKARQAFKEKLSKLFKDLDEERNLNIPKITTHLIEKLPDLNIKIDAVYRWSRGESAPIEKHEKRVLDVLNALLKPSWLDPQKAEYETYRSSIKQVYLSGIIRTIPKELKEFWKKQYYKTFRLYNWQHTFSIIKLAELRQELELLDSSFPKQTGIYAQISKLIPVAKEIEDGQGYYLVNGFNDADKDFGIYLWNTNGYYEYPLFIANSIPDLINDHIITLEKEDNLYFDPEKCLNETFKKNMKGYILLLNNNSKDIHTPCEKIEEFYEKAFKMHNSGTIKFEASGELITVSIESENFKRLTYNIKDESLFHFIEKLNDELNAMDKSNFCRPKYYGYYLINEKYLAYLRLDIATDLIQKGYINSRFKMLPMLAFCNPTITTNFFSIFRAFAETEKNQEIIWI